MNSPIIATPKVTKYILDRFKLTANKKLGQNFLIDPEVVRRIAEAAELTARDQVLEIGPGIGTLTQGLAESGARVVAVELDQRLLPVLATTLKDYSNVQIIQGDILQTPIMEHVEPGFKCCANLPYYITTPILTALLEARCFDTITVMVQKEVALRMAARPGTGDYGAFSILCQYYAEPELLFEVPPSCFLPQPKVTSAVVKLNIRRELPWQIDDPELFFRVVRTSFAMRRKSLQNGLASGFPELGRAGAAEVLESCGLNPGIRGETLDIPTFAAIVAEIQRRRNHD